MISMRSAFFTFRSESLEEYICMAYGPAVRRERGEALRGGCGIECIPPSSSAAVSDLM